MFDNTIEENLRVLDRDANRHAPNCKYGWPRS